MSQLYKQFPNILILFFIALVATLIMSYFSPGKIVVNNYYGSGGTTTDGGEIQTGVSIDLPNISHYTGDINTGEAMKLIDIDLYNTYKSNNNYRSYFPDSQSRVIGNYGTNTEYMTKYLSNHTFKFFLPEGVLTGYLYVRIKKPTDNDIFVYWYNSKDEDGYKVSGDLEKTGSLIFGSETEFLYDLNKIPYKKYYDKSNAIYDWQNQLDQKNNYIAMFVKDFDGSNQVEEITIARE